MSKYISPEEQEQIRAFYKSRPMTMADLSKEFGYCFQTLQKILGDIPRYTKTQLWSPGLKEDFFERIDTEEKAYFLGLMITDGNVFKANDHRASISFTLDDHDAYLLEYWRKCVNASTVVTHDGRGCSQHALRSLKMANDLAKYGVIPRKTLHAYLPTIEDETQMRHLIRGLIDGDGGIYAYLPDDDTHYRHKITLCGTERLMQGVVDYITSVLYFEHKPHVYTYKNKPLSEFRVSNVEDMNTLGDWMYKDATVYMDRKYQKFLAFQNHYGIANTEVSRQITQG